MKIDLSLAMPLVDILFLSMAGLQHEYFEFYGDICLEKSNPGLSSVLVEI